MEKIAITYQAHKLLITIFASYLLLVLLLASYAFCECRKLCNKYYTL